MPDVAKWHGIQLGFDWRGDGRRGCKPHLPTSVRQLGDEGLPRAVEDDLDVGFGLRHRGRDLRHWEMFGQLDWTVGEATAYLGGAHSREYVFAGGEAAGKFTERTTVGATLELGFASDQMVEMTAEGQETDDPDGKSYRDYILSAAYYPGYDLTLIATAEKTTSHSSDRDSWFIAEVRKLVFDDFEVSLSAGTERGGKKCTGGVCFIEPEFEGVRMRFTRFF